MHKIYFDRRCLVICGPGEALLPGPGAGILKLDGNPGLPALIRTIGSRDCPAMACMTSEDPEACYRDICSLFVEVTAGGGLVRNGSGECLLIRRNGLWDLPKGHLEPGEDIGECSLREVREETGADGLQLQDLICTTDHCYLRDGRWHLKHTWWYGMSGDGGSVLTPQTEEGISSAVWVESSRVAPLFAETYPSIREVFRAAKLADVPQDDETF